MDNKEFIESIRLEGEEWRDVPGWEGIYMFSSEGRVASVKTEFFYTGRKKPRKVEPALLKLSKNKTRNGGYDRLMAYLHRDKVCIYVHRLVAEAFVYNPEPERFTEVDHIDGNPRNNRASNLRWTDRHGNMMNPVSRKRISAGQRGKVYPKSRVQVVRISENGETNVYERMSDVAKDGFSLSSVSQCCSGMHNHIHKGFWWMRLSDYEKLQASMSKNSDPTPDN